MFKCNELSILGQIPLMKNQSELHTAKTGTDSLRQHTSMIPVPTTHPALQPETKQPSTNSDHHFEPSFLKPAKAVINEVFATVEKYAGLNTIGCISKSLVFYNWKDYA